MEKYLLILTALLCSTVINAQDNFAYKTSDGEREAFSISYHIQARNSASDGDYDKAFTSINKAIEYSPTNVAHMTFKAIMILRNTIEKDQALPILNEVVERTNLSSEAYYFRGMAKRHADRMDGACDDFQRAATLNYPLAEGTYGKYCMTRVMNILASIE